MNMNSLLHRTTHVHTQAGSCPAIKPKPGTHYIRVVCTELNGAKMRRDSPAWTPQVYPVISVNGSKMVGGSAKEVWCWGLHPHAHDASHLYFAPLSHEALLGQQ